MTIEDKIVQYAILEWPEETICKHLKSVGYSVSIRMIRSVCKKRKITLKTYKNRHIVEPVKINRSKIKINLDSV